MFLKRKMNDSTTSYSDKILQIKEKIEEADAIIIGAGAGFSTSAGFVYNGEAQTFASSGGFVLPDHPCQDITR